MPLTFKTASPSHIPTITQLADKIWRSHYVEIIGLEQVEYMIKNMYSEEQLLKQMNSGHVFTLVYLNNEPTAYISVSTKDNAHYFIHKFYVLVNKHRNGIGTDILNHLLQELPQARTFELTVNRQNYKAINFYFKNGFVIKEIADFDIGEGYFMNDFVMVKTIF
jgi:ribosomal protein S18 acetylase RimI-like enzyme